MVIGIIFGMMSVLLSNIFCIILMIFVDVVCGILFMIVVVFIFWGIFNLIESIIGY